MAQIGANWNIVQHNVTKYSKMLLEPNGTKASQYTQMSNTMAWVYSMQYYGWLIVCFDYLIIDYLIINYQSIQKSLFLYARMYIIIYNTLYANSKQWKIYWKRHYTLDIHEINE